MMPLPISEDHIRPMPSTDARREKVVAALKARGGSAECGELAADTGLSSSTVRNALRRLEWTKDVVREGGGKSTKHNRAVFRLVAP
jgi:DeoR/GlpR family transcriptional regulator of sugar metabolism